MNSNKYKKLWIALVRIVPKGGFSFNELVDLSDEIDETYGQRDINAFVGAWANILVVAENISSALQIIPKGLNELELTVDVIDKIENTQSLINDNELSSEVLTDIDWLIGTSYKFKIVGRIFPFDKDEFEINPYPRH